MEWMKLTHEERKAEFEKRCIALSKAISKMAFKPEDIRRSAEAIAEVFNKPKRNLFPKSKDNPS